MIEYDDFSLKIEPKQGDIYPVIVLHSPAGEGRSTMTLPFQPDEIGDILFDLGGTVRSSGVAPTRDVSPVATHTRPQQIGDQLFNALFSGTTRTLLDRSLGMIHGQHRGLRIKLHIDPEDPSLAQLASLPWEFLYRKETRDFLNLSRFTPIIRYLDVQRPYSPLPLNLPLRILVIISDPVDYPRLDLDRERSLIESSWAKHEGVQVEFMEQATILALQDRLSEQPYHVLHYMGHGGLEKWTGRGVLVMEDEGGQGSLVDGRTLGILLRDLPMMRLAFLNACETAKATKEKGVDPFAGVAAAMVLAGIPAVVAMQFPVSDKAAITFSQKFYPLLARGEPVDAAVAEGRRAIRLAANQTMEWGTPVLFLRAPQGIIFQVSEIQREKVPVPTIPEIPEIPEEEQELEKQIADIYTRALSFFWLEEWEKAARNFQTIVKVRPNYEDAAEKLIEARRQAKLHALYVQVLSAEEEENWSNALAALQELTANAADFKDSAERLERIKVQNQLAELYDEALHLHQAQQWQAVVNVFEQIHIIEPNYPDPEGLLPAAEREAIALRRQAELNDLYSQAVSEVNAGHWQESWQLLVQVKGIEPDFLETERLLARVEQEIERQEKEHRRQEQIATYYEQALGLAQARQWRQVLAKIDEIQSLDPEFADPEGLAAEAREELTKEDEEAQRQSELATLYAEAVQLLEAEQYQQALEKLGEVQARDPRYPDRQKVQINARKQLESMTKGAPQKRRLPSWAVATIIGGLILAGIISTLFFRPTISTFLFTNEDESMPSPTVLVETEVPTEPIGPEGTSGAITEMGDLTCTECHNNTTLLIGKRTAWRESRHGSGETYVRGVSASCAGCHSGGAFSARVAAGLHPDAIDEGDPNPTRQDCRACHQIHTTFTGEDWALETTDAVTLYALQEATYDGGKGNLCVNCHQPRRVFPAAENGMITIISEHWGPHHGGQGSMMLGVAGAGDVEGSPSPHYQIIEDTCVDCHMGSDRVHIDYSYANCQECHADAENFFYDINGVQTEVQAQLDELGEALVAAGVLSENSPEGHPTVGEVPEEIGIALWNWIYIAHEDKSLGVHNPAYTKTLLDESLAALGLAR